MHKFFLVLFFVIFWGSFGLIQAAHSTVCVEAGQPRATAICQDVETSDCPEGFEYEVYENCAEFNEATVPSIAPINTEVGSPEENVSGDTSASDGGLIEPCALQDPKRGDANAYCNDVNDLLSQLIRIARYLFGIIGSLALLFFIYGGMTMILSFGSADKFKQGRDIMVAAVVGMMIAFSAYIVINFVLDALGVTSNFRGL